MDNRKLGWIAIGLGVLALVFAVGGRSRSQGWYNDGPRFNGPMTGVPQGPGAQQWQPGPQGQAPQAGPQGQAPQVGPQGDFGPRQWGRPDGWRDNHRGGFGPGGPHHFGGWFFLPFKIIGGLFRLALFGLLILLAVQWFRRRRGNGTQDPPSPPTPPSQERPGPEQPPYTGGTQAL
jgi:hypothetical protein